MAQPISTTSGVNIPISSTQSTSSTDHTYHQLAASPNQPRLSIQQRSLSTHQTFGFFTPLQPDERDDPRFALSDDPEDINIDTAAPEDIFGETLLVPVIPAQHQPQPEATTQSIQPPPESRGEHSALTAFKHQESQQVHKPHPYSRSSSSTHLRRSKTTHTVSKAPDQQTKSKPTLPTAKVKSKPGSSYAGSSLRFALKKSLLTTTQDEQPTPQSTQEVSAAPSASAAGKLVAQSTSKDESDSEAPSPHPKAPKVKPSKPLTPSPMLDFIIGKLKKDECLHWKHNIKPDSPALNKLKFDKSILDTMENGTFIKDSEHNHTLGQHWSLYSKHRQLKPKSKQVAYEHFMRSFRLQYQHETIKHITQPDPEKDYDPHSPVYKLNIGHPQVAQYLEKHNVTFN